MVKQKTTKTKSALTTKNILLILGGTIVIAAAIVGALRVNQPSNSQSTLRPRWEAKSDLNHLSQDFSPTGSMLAVKDIQDNACVNTSNFGQPASPCELMLYKYYRNSGSLEANMRAADKLLVSLGWVRNADEQKFNRAVAGGACQVNYTKKAAPQYSVILWCRQSDSSEVIQLGDSEIGVSKGEYIYGIEANEVYDGIKTD